MSASLEITSRQSQRFEYDLELVVKDNDGLLMKLDLIQLSLLEDMYYLSLTYLRPNTTRKTLRQMRRHFTALPQVFIAQVIPPDERAERFLRYLGFRPTQEVCGALEYRRN